MGTRPSATPAVGNLQHFLPAPHVLGVKLSDKVSNQELYTRTEQPAMPDMLRLHRLRWLGHLAREPDESPLLQLLSAHTVPGFEGRQAGRQRTWIACAEADLREKGLPVVGWFDLAQDRKAWADKIAISK